MARLRLTAPRARLRIAGSTVHSERRPVWWQDHRSPECSSACRSALPGRKPDTARDAWHSGCGLPAAGPITTVSIALRVLPGKRQRARAAAVALGSVPPRAVVRDQWSRRRRPIRFVDHAFNWASARQRADVFVFSRAQIGHGAIARSLAHRHTTLSGLGGCAYRASTDYGGTVPRASAVICALPFARALRTVRTSLVYKARANILGETLPHHDHRPPRRASHCTACYATPRWLHERLR
jgi:hypothetical protein